MDGIDIIEVSDDKTEVINEDYNKILTLSSCYSDTEKTVSNEKIYL